MDINQSFPTKYLKASDITGTEPVLCIARVVLEEMEDGKEKPVVYFTNADKGLVLNKTNSMNIATIYGPETNNWANRTIQLYTTWVDYQGRSVEAVRVKPQVPQATQAPPAQQAAVQQPPQTTYPDPAMQGPPPVQAPAAPPPAAPNGPQSEDEIKF